jgi:hypothetical protein
VGGATIYNTIRLGAFKAAMQFTPQIGVTAMAVSVIAVVVVSRLTKDVPTAAVERSF